MDPRLQFLIYMMSHQQPSPADPTAPNAPSPVRNFGRWPGDDVGAMPEPTQDPRTQVMSGGAGQETGRLPDSSEEIAWRRARAREQYMRMFPDMPESFIEYFLRGPDQPTGNR